MKPDSAIADDKKKHELMNTICFAVVYKSNSEDEEGCFFVMP